MSKAEAKRFDAPDEVRPFAGHGHVDLVHLSTGDVGLATFDRDIRKLVRPSGNPSHLKQIIHVLEESPGEKKTATGPIFHQLAERFTKRGVVLIFSDLFDNVAAMTAGLKHFRHRRHDVAGGATVALWRMRCGARGSPRCCWPAPRRRLP